MLLSKTFDEALRYASDVHRTQMRKATDTPYVSHLLAVAAMVLEHRGNEIEAISALLHDAPEDQGGRKRLDDIRTRFGNDVADIVEALSDALAEDPSRKPEWRERKADYHAHLRKCTDSSVLLVSAADKLHNARTTLNDIHRSGDEVWNRFVREAEDLAEKKKLSLWNYDELVKIYAKASDERVRDVASELTEVVKMLRTATKRESPGFPGRRA